MSPVPPNFPAGVWCWCCARWGLSVVPAEGKDICARCANSSPSACEKRHIAQALQAGKDTPCG